jgi:hypothetical protein
VRSEGDGEPRCFVHRVIEVVKGSHAAATGVVSGMALQQLDDFAAATLTVADIDQRLRGASVDRPVQLRFVGGSESNSCPTTRTVAGAPGNPPPSTLSAPPSTLSGSIDVPGGVPRQGQKKKRKHGQTRTKASNHVPSPPKSEL